MIGILRNLLSSPPWAATAKGQTHVLETYGITEPNFGAKIVRIANTLELEMMEVSEPCLTALSARGQVECLSTPYELRFDVNGNLA